MADRRVEVHRGPDGLRALAGDWSRLADDTPRAPFYCRPEWYECWLSHLSDDPGSLQVFVVRAGASLLAVLPLCQTRRRVRGIPLSVLELPGYDVPLHDALFANGHAPGELLQQILPELRCDLIRLTHLEQGSALAAALDQAEPARMQRKTARQADVLPAAVYEERLANFSRNFRGNLRKARNKLDALDEARLVALRERPGLDDAYERFLEVEASGWKASSEATRLDQRKVEFYRSVIHRFAARGECEIRLLREGDATLAAQLSLISAGMHYLLKIGFDESRSRIAPGNMLLEQLLRQCENLPVHLISDAAWHLDWKAERHPVYHYYLGGPTLKGRALDTVARWL